FQIRIEKKPSRIGPPRSGEQTGRRALRFRLIQRRRRLFSQRIPAISCDDGTPLLLNTLDSDCPELHKSIPTMDSGFIFEAPSDEELEEYDSEYDEDENEGTKPSNKKAQSPWDFSSYTESVAEEHERRRTTSIDYKISKAREQRNLPLEIPSDDEEDSNAETHELVEDKLEEADDQENAVVDSKSFFAPSDGVSFHAKSFMELNLSRPLLRACEALGYSKPTPIQAACVPLALTGRDICGSAVTGSGKTAAFALPTLERLLFRPKRVAAIRVLILTPARELAVQIHSMIEKLAQFTDIRCCIIIGGLSSKVQEAALRSMPDIV
ncbi:DEAD-box ATP-dependent RNA helicase 28-like protein, partial [Drosera capensis]